ncbi:MAG TPA: hypothetical protein VIP11_05945, partial [Gemmatimonadaceae bacterium]
MRSRHQRNASGTPVSGRTCGVHPSSRLARDESNGLSRVSNLREFLLTRLARPPLSSLVAPSTTENAARAAASG